MPFCRENVEWRCLTMMTFIMSVMSVFTFGKATRFYSAGPDLKLDADPVSVRWTRSRLACADICSMSDSCSGFNYHQNTSSCEMFQACFGFGIITPQSGYNYYMHVCCWKTTVLGRPQNEYAFECRQLLI